MVIPPNRQVSETIRPLLDQHLQVDMVAIQLVGACHLLMALQHHILVVESVSLPLMPTIRDLAQRREVSRNNRMEVQVLAPVLAQAARKCTLLMGVSMAATMARLWGVDLWGLAQWEVAAIQYRPNRMSSRRQSIW